MRRAIIACGVAGLLAVVGGVVPASAESNRDDGHGSSKHVFVIMMENTGYDALIGNANAPWINAAANKYGLATNYFGVTHPSQPNYIAMTSGSTNGVPNDNDITVNVANVADQLEARGLTWKSYNQNLSLCLGNLLAHSCGNQLYERKHNPFVSYADVQSSPSRMARNVDLTQLDADLASGNVPNYSFIVPDQCNDMHGRAAAASDPCNFGDVQGLISTGDSFLSTWVGKIMASKAWRHDSTIFVVWDESDFTGSPTNFGFGDGSGCCDSVPGSGGGHVVALVISPEQEEHTTSAVAFNHYSVLRTVEQMFHLGCLAFTCDKANVPSMRDLVSGDD